MFKGYQKSTPVKTPVKTPVAPAVDPGLDSPWGAPVGVETQDSTESPIYAADENRFDIGSSGVSASAVATRNVLNSDVKVVGVLRFTDDLLVDGTVQGEIESEGVLTVGVNAVIEAGDKNKVAVRTRSAIIHGRVTGNVEVTDRVELTATSELLGDVVASKISIQEGAIFNGYCKVGVPTNAAAAPAPQASAVSAKKGKNAATVASDNLLD